MLRALRAGVLVTALIGGIAAPSASLAHWCDCLWASAYNIVVRPETDELVFSGDSTNLYVVIQNNMGYPLGDFDLVVDAPGYSVDQGGITVSAKVSGYLMPGERQRYTIPLTRNGGGATLDVSTVQFYVGFGNGSSQDSGYGASGSYGEDVVIRMNSGTLVPGSANVGSAGGQARQLGAVVRADYPGLGGDVESGINDLLGIYCAGRGSWNSGGAVLSSSYCSDLSSVSCPDTVSRSDSKYDWQHLWAAEFAAARKSAMNSQQLTALRQGLMCGYDDEDFGFKAMATVLLGYLGEDAAARSFLENVISTGSSEEQAVAKAALLMFNDSGDRALYHGDVFAGLNHSEGYVQIASAATLGILDADNCAVEDELISRARWVQPDTNDQGLSFSAAHLLDLVAWHRRGWQADSGDTGVASFYEISSDTSATEAPGSLAAVSSSGETVELTWDAVTSDTITSYRIYWGQNARPGSCTRAEDSCSGYEHTSASSNPSATIAGLGMSSTYYFAVTAVDDGCNESDFSSETSTAVLGTPQAVISCSASEGIAPLSITCNGHSSTDPNGASDIVSYFFSLNGGAETDESDGEIEYTLSDPQSYSIVLRVVDNGGLSSSDSTTVQVNTASNQSPTAQAGATPDNGAAPLTVQFSSAGSDDPDGTITSTHWDFDDSGATSSESNPSYTFQNAGTYQVWLTVTDDGSPALTGTAPLTITVIEASNNPPDLSLATASPMVGEAPLTVQFSADSIHDPDGDTFTLLWDFDEAGATSSDSATSHTYQNNGTYQVELTAQDDGTPAIGPARKTFEIIVTDNTPPDATAATVTPLTGAPPLKIQLNAADCSDADGDNLSYHWNVATSGMESEVYEEAEASHTFDKKGSYEVTLRLTDDGDPPLQTSKVFTVNVKEASDGSSLSLSEGWACAASDGTGSGWVVGVLFGLLAWRRRTC